MGAGAISGAGVADSNAGVALLDGLAETIVVLNRKGVIVGCNQSWKRFAEENGGSAELAMGVGLSYLRVCEAAAATGMPAAQACLDGLDRLLNGSVSSFELDYDCHSPEQERYFSMRAALAGTSGLYVIAHRDITTRTLARRAVEVSERRFRGVADAAPVAIYETDASGRCTFVNERWLALSGMRAAESLGTGWTKVLHVDDRYRIFEAWNKAVNSLEPFEEDYRFVGPSGTRMVHGRAVPVIGGDGECCGWVGVVEDVTEMHAAAEALQRSEEFHRAIFQASPLPVLVYDVETMQILAANEAAVRQYGYSAGELVQMTIKDIRPPEDVPRFMSLHAKHHDAPAEGPYMVRGDWRHRRKNGEIFYVDIYAHPLRFSGRRAHLVIALDVTERRRSELARQEALAEAHAAREQALRASQAKDQFLAILSHELRTPLAPIMAGAGYLRHALASDRADLVNVLGVIERNVMLQARMVEDLLDLSRINRGKVSLSRAPASLERLVALVVDTWKEEARRARVNLQSHVLARLWTFGDFDRLQQVLGNLVGNAIKFTPAGGTVDVRLEERGEEAVLSVVDTGIGVAAAALPNIFDMFEQGEAGGRSKGLGIGLALVKSLTEMHGGHVAASSAGLNRGSCFTVVLPTSRAPDGEVSLRLREELQHRAPVLLLVEDSEDTRRLQAASLRELGYVVVEAGSAEEAFSVLNGTQPDVLLADITLPGMDGYELLRRMRSQAGFGKVVAFALTASAGEEAVGRARAAGYQAHFAKPVDVDVLDARLRECLAWTGAAIDASGLG